MNFSYETETISYETMRISYEKTVVSYETGALSYEMKGNSYELTSISHEVELNISRFDQSEEEICCGKDSIRERRNPLVQERLLYLQNHRQGLLQYLRQSLRS